MMEQEIQMDTMVLLGDLGDVSEQGTKVPIQQDALLNDNTMVGGETCGDELVLGVLQLEEN